MRKLTAEEIKSVEEIGTNIAKIDINGMNEHLEAIPYQILVISYKFVPDAKHKHEACSDGYSKCCEVALFNVTENKIQESRYFTQCTESELFIHVGNYMGSVYLLNTLADRYYLEGFDSTIES